MKRLFLSNEKQINYKQHYSFQIKNTAIGRLTQTRNINEILCKQGENIFANYLHRRPLDICMMYQWIRSCLSGYKLIIIQGVSLNVCTTSFTTSMFWETFLLLPCFNNFFLINVFKCSAFFHAFKILSKLIDQIYYTTLLKYAVKIH